MRNSEAISSTRISSAVPLETNLRYYKILNEDGTTFHHSFRWPIPTGSRPGEWMPKVEGDLALCKNGYHVLRLEHLVHWLHLGPVIVEVEIRGEILEDDGREPKACCREVRPLRRLHTWTPVAAQLFAADCAEHVLYIVERDNPGDDRPRQAIEVARRFARGEAKEEEREAALEAVWAVASAAARAAAGAAAWGAIEATAAAERRWQTARLAQYLEHGAAAEAMPWLEARETARPIEEINP